LRNDQPSRHGEVERAAENWLPRQQLGSLSSFNAVTFYLHPQLGSEHSVDRSKLMLQYEHVVINVKVVNSFLDTSFLFGQTLAAQPGSLMHQL
jgi:hypothetical protein